MIVFVSDVPAVKLFAIANSSTVTSSPNPYDTVPSALKAYPLSVYPSLVNVANAGVSTLSLYFFPYNTCAASAPPFAVKVTSYTFATCFASTVYACAPTSKLVSVIFVPFT